MYFNTLNLRRLFVFISQSPQILPLILVWLFVDFSHVSPCPAVVIKPSGIPCSIF